MVSGEAQKPSEEYAYYFDFAPAGYLILDAKGLILQANLAAANLLGVERSEAIGQPVTRFVFRDDQDVYFLCREPLSGTGRPDACELRLDRRDGALRWVQMQSMQAQGGDEAQVCRVMLSDITDRKQTEAALRASERHFRHVANTISDIAYSCRTDADGSYAIDWMTGATERITGYTVAEITAHRCLRYLVVEEDAGLFETHVTGLVPGASAACDLRMRRKDGEIAWISSFAECTPDEEQPGRRRLYASLVDITERKKVEADLQRANRLLDMIVENIPNMIFLKDAEELRFVRHNRAGNDLLGFSRKELLGKNDYDLFPPEEAEFFIQKDRQTLQEKVVVDIPEETIQARFQGRRILHTKKVPILNANGEPEYLLGISEDITERKQTEQALRESEKRYRTLFEHAPVGIFQSSSEGEVFFVNPAFARMFGYDSPEQFVSYANEVGMARAIYWDPDDRPRVVQQTERSGEWQQFESHYRRRDGSEMFGNLRLAAQSDGDGTTYLTGFIEDITERKQAEETLQKSEASLKAIFENSIQSYMLLDRDRRVQALNRIANEWASAIYGREIHPGDSIYDYMESQARTGFESDFERVLAGESLQFERSFRAGKNEVWYEYHIAPVRADDGRVTGVFLGTTDITERKQAEVERERLLAHVQAQARQIAQILDSVPEGVLLLEADGRVLSANAAGVRELVTLAGAAVGERLNHLGNLPLAELLAARASGGLWHHIRDGERTVEAIARPLVAVQSGAGSLEAGQWVLVINDVTYARQMRDQLQQQERLAAIGQLAAGIAHDFNNILAVIGLHAPQVAAAPGLSEHDRERLTVIIEQTDHATRLVQQLLDFSRRAVLERRPLDLAPLLREQVKLLERTLPETIQVSLAYEPGAYMVLADPTRLQQMLMNLAVNARDAMPAGGTLGLALARQATAPRPELPDGPWVRLEVADSGSGMTLEAQAHLFEPFFTTKPPGQGTGLGLAQVHGIVKQHEGEIVVHSAAGLGTTFSIYLPAVPELAPAAAAPEAAAQEGGGETILLVEDNAALREAMCDLIAALGYDVVGANNGVEALAVLEARGGAIALVLSDLMMPVMGGEALLAAIQARGLSVPVVMLSGYPLEGELTELKARGLAGWLLKPVRRAELAGLLAQVLASPRS